MRALRERDSVRALRERQCTGTERETVYCTIGIMLFPDEGVAVLATTEPSKAVCRLCWHWEAMAL